MKSLKVLLSIHLYNLSIIWGLIYSQPRTPEVTICVKVHDVHLILY